ncbi:hypothetical protein IAR50_002632 [Cryptococcus sp. DSM 104548]
MLSYTPLLSALLLVAVPALGAPHPTPEKLTMLAVLTLITGPTADAAAIAGSASAITIYSNAATTTAGSAFAITILSSVTKSSSSVAKSSSSSVAASATQALYVDIQKFSKLHSVDANEGSGDGQKRPYGVTGPNAVSFYQSSSTAAPSAIGTDATYNPQAWTTATGTPTKIIECVATASATMTQNMWLVPSPDLSTIEGGVGVKCTDAAT